MTEPRPSPGPVAEPSDPWPDSPLPTLDPLPGAVAATRRRWWWRASAVAVTAVLAVAAFVVALSWPRTPPPDPAVPFQPLALAGELDFAEPSGNTFSRVVGARAYLGWQQGDDLELAAVDLASGERAWTTRVAGRAGVPWGGLIATPEAVVGYGYPFGVDDSGELGPSDPVPMMVLDAQTGGQRYQWDRDVYRDDEAWVVDQTLVLVDRRKGALRGLHLDSGAPRWVVPFPRAPWADQEESEDGDGEAGERVATAAVLPVLTADHLSAPSTWWGAALVPSPDRLVLVGEDRSARLIDARDGQAVGAAGTNVADPGDVLLAYSDRLFVAAGHEGYQVYQRELDRLTGQPALVYTTPDPERRLAAPLAPCGAALLCVLDEAAAGAGTAQVRALDLATGGGPAGDPQRWYREVPGAEWLVPAGQWLLVGGERGLAGYDRHGEQVLDQPDGAGARIDADSLLLFATWPESHAQDLSVAGLTAGGARVELGQLPGVHGDRCSWNDTYLVCPGEDRAGIWRFAAG